VQRVEKALAVQRLLKIFQDRKISFALRCLSSRLEPQLSNPAHWQCGDNQVY
jgi:hypothetical protein